MRIVLLNNNSEAIDYEKNHQEDNDVILPLGPSARYYALEKGWKIRILGSLLSKEDYLEAKKDSDQRIKTLVEELNWYSKSVTKNFPVEIGNYFQNNLLIVVGSIHYNYFIFRSIQKAINPSNWLLFSQRNEKYHRRFFPSSDLVMFGVFQNCGFTENGLVLDAPFEKQEAQKKGLKEIIKGYLPEWMLEKIFAVNNSLKTFHILPFSKKKLLMLGGYDNYDWEPLIRDKQFKSKYHIQFERGNHIPPTVEATKELKDILDRSVTYAGKVVYDLSVQARMLQGAIRYYDSQSVITKKRLKKTDGVLVNMLPFPMHNYIAHIAVSMGKPVILWEHGEHIGNLSQIDFASELQYSTHYLTFGYAVQKKFEQHIGSNYLKEVFTVGSTKRNIVRYKSEIILYATGKWLYSLVAFPNTIDPDTRLYNCQKNIINYLCEIGLDHKVTLKASNTPGRNEIPFGCQNIQIDSTSPFTKCLQTAKLVILDAPGTTLIEAVSTDVPLFLVSGRVPWEKSTIEILKKRAIVVDSTDDLISHLRMYFKDGTYPADVNNKEFLKGFGSIESIADVKKNAIKVLDQVLV